MLVGEVQTFIALSFFVQDSYGAFSSKYLIIRWKFKYLNQKIINLLYFLSCSLYQISWWTMGYLISAVLREYVAKYNQHSKPKIQIIINDPKF